MKKNLIKFKKIQMIQMIYSQLMKLNCNIKEIINLLIIILKDFPKLFIQIWIFNLQKVDMQQLVMHANMLQKQKKKQISLLKCKELWAKYNKMNVLKN